MLRKLIKHEIIASYRIHLTMYGSIILLALVSSGTFNSNISLIGSVFFGLMMLSIGALGVFTLYNFVVSMNQRVYGKQGYLLFSVPASTVQIILSKVIVNVIWLILTSAVSIFAISMFMVVVLPAGTFQSLSEQFFTFIEFSPMDIIAFFVYGLTMILYQIGFFQFLFGLLNHIYKGEKKTLVGVLLYFGVNYVVTLVISVLSGSYQTGMMDGEPYLFQNMWVSIGVYLLVTCGLYYGTYVFIEKKLELQ